MFRKILKWLWEFVEILIIIYVIFITSCILCRNKFGYTQFGNMTFVTVNDNNAKFFANNKSGDLLIIKGQQIGLNTGDVIYYYVTVDEKYVVRTNVIADKEEDDYAALYILNDDDGTSIASNRVIGKYVSVHPGLGGTLDVLESRVGFLFLVLLPILIVFIYQIYQLVVVAKYEVVEEDEKEVPRNKVNTLESKVEEKVVEVSKKVVQEEKKEEEKPLDNNDNDNIELL